jgi:hypothetical protein
MSLEPPENARNQKAYPKHGSFANLLDWHLDFGLFGGLDLSSPEIADQKETNNVAEMDLGIVISGPQRSVSDRQGPAIAKIPIHRQRQEHQVTRCSLLIGSDDLQPLACFVPVVQPLAKA